MNFGEPMQRNIDQDAEEDAEEYFYGCEFHDCTHSFEREDDLEQHYTSFHSADVYTSQIQESSVRKLLPHEVKSKAKSKSSWPTLTNTSSYMPRNRYFLQKRVSAP